MELIDKTAIVTGGSRGIGRGIALRLIEEGANLAFCFQTNSSAADRMIREINDMGGIAFGKKVDVSKRSEVSSFFQDVLSRYGKLDVLVNNAGIQIYKPFLEHEVKDWHRVLEVNLTGTFNCCQIAGRIMSEQKYGKIINIWYCWIDKIYCDGTRPLQY